MQCGSISLLVGYLFIPWCELPLCNINEKFHNLLSAFFILVCNLYHMDDLVVSIGITLGASSKYFGFGKLSIGQYNNTLRLQ